MIERLFPYRLHLHILQLEGYELPRFLRWLIYHPFTRTVEGKKPLVWTSKARLLLALAWIWSLVFGVALVLLWSWPGLLISVLLYAQSYFFLSLAVLSLKPYEYLNRQRVKKRTYQKIVSMPQLKVIGITGSYGKTSVKEFLYHFMRQHYAVLKTPESYNTLFGIAKVVKFELDPIYDYFICEMGAYHIGEIRELCQMAQPNFGILTGINEQHLERFGSIENTTKAKFELVEAIPSSGFALVNTDNQRIADHYQQYQTTCFTYGLHGQDFTCVGQTNTANGLDFTLQLDDQQVKFSTPLFGQANLSNLVAAIVMAHKLGVPMAKLQQATLTLQPVPHRLEVKHQSDMIVIDDAYNSNVDGFKEALNVLAGFKDQSKILITPGIVELGEKNDEIHQELGKIANGICNMVLLVGHSPRTKAVASALDPAKTQFLSSIKDYPQAVAKLNLKNPVVLLENDLTDNY